MFYRSGIPKLLNLIQENPDLPVFPIIREEVHGLSTSKSFALCDFEDAYVMEFAEYIIFDTPELITKNQYFITDEILRKNGGEQPKWYKGIFVTIKPVEQPEEKREHHGFLGSISHPQFYCPTRCRQQDNGLSEGWSESS